MQVNLNQEYPEEGREQAMYSELLINERDAFEFGLRSYPDMVRKTLYKEVKLKTRDRRIKIQGHARNTGRKQRFIIRFDRKTYSNY